MSLCAIGLAAYLSADVSLPRHPQPSMSKT